MKRTDRRKALLEQSNPRTDQAHANPNSTSAQDRKPSLTGSVFVEGGIEVHLPPHIQKRKSASDERRETRESIRQWVEGIALFFVILLTGIDGYQAWVFHRQFQSNEESLKLERRAWVGVQGKQPPLLKDELGNLVHVVAGSPPKIEMVAIDSGKSPALEVTFRSDFRIQSRSERVGPVYPPPERQPQYQKSSMVIQPSQSIGIPIGSGDTIVLGPQIHALKQGIDIFYFFGVVDYKDIFGDSHETAFCYFLHQDLAGASACSTYNSAS